MHEGGKKRLYVFVMENVLGEVWVVDTLLSKSLQKHQRPLFPDLLESLSSSRDFSMF
jgi:hypothetical protein